jgi:phosphatidylglycerophosphatase A
MNRFYKFMGSGFGAGWLPVAPGTWGAAVAVLPLFFFTKTHPSVSDTFGRSSNAIFSSFHGIYTFILTILVVIFTWIGVKAVDFLQEEWGDDPKQVVIDEMIGVWIAILGLPLTVPNLILGFILFRFFDIAKPLGIRQLEKIKGGWGVMLDDVLAGVYANIILQVLNLFYFN